MIQYYPSINVLRGIAALLVCIFHFSTYADLHGSLFESDQWIYSLGKYGYQGIYMFFVISGFVIPLSMRKHQYTIRNIHRFLSRRWIRIELPYLSSILLVLIIQLIYVSKNESVFTIEWQRIFHHLFYTIPFTDYDWYNIIYWTLAIEFQFYILIAIVYFLLQNKEKWIAIGSILAISIIGVLYDDIRLVFFYMPLFGLGMLLNLFLLNKISIKLFLLALTGLSFMVFLNFGTTVLITSFLSLFFIYIIKNENKIGQFLGNISYSLYLTHGLIGGQLLYLFQRHTSDNWTSTVLFISAITLSILFAYGFWFAIERPAIRWSKKVKIKAPR